MFQQLLAFMLINSCYLSLGKPTQSVHMISYSLTNLAKQCENKFLSKAISAKINECNVLAPPYLQKQIRCLIFYDINKQLCEGVATSRITVTEDVTAKKAAEEDITAVCTLAQDWVFSNITEYEAYKNTSQHLFRNLITCGEICSAEDTISAVNDYCKYYKWGIEILKNQVITTSDNLNHIAVVAPGKSLLDSIIKSDKVSGNSEGEISEVAKSKTLDMSKKLTDSAVLNSTPKKFEESGDIDVQKSTALTTSTKLAAPQAQQESAPAVVKNVEDGHALEQPVLLEVNTNEQSNKSVVLKEIKQTGEENDPAPLLESGKDGPSLDSKGIDQVDGKAPGDDEYGDSEGNDGGDDDGEVQGMDIKPEKKPDPFVNNKVIISHDGDISQKEFYPNTISDTYTDDGDNFFPFFLTAIILVVLLYVLYHNKSKVSKVFFGLILEGRQAGRRRNSRGHAYRRLDTLEQAMSANTAAPPSKIIY